MEKEIGKMALIGDVWCQIMDVHIKEEEKIYKLYSKDYLVPESWIKDIKEKEEI